MAVFGHGSALRWVLERIQAIVGHGAGLDMRCYISRGRENGHEGHQA